MKRIYKISAIVLSLVLFFTYVANAQLSGKVILIDPGHGGTDPGALGVNGSTYPDEADLVLDGGLDLRTQLQSASATVYMTRSTDVYIDLYDRRDLANAYNPDVYFSMHLNSAVSTALGTETWYNYNTVLATHMQDKLIENMGTVDRGIKQESWAVLTCDSWIPACLTEGCFLSNDSDWALITSPSGFDSWIIGHEQGIYSFFLVVRMHTY